MGMLAVSVTDEAWDGFCAASPSAWFWHTTRWRDYTLAYRPDLETRWLGFGVESGGRLVAVVPLTLERHAGRAAFTFGGSWCWAPAVAAGLPAVVATAAVRAALERVDTLASEYGADRAAFAVSPLVPDLAGAALRWIPAPCGLATSTPIGPRRSWTSPFGPTSY